MYFANEVIVFYLLTKDNLILLTSILKQANTGFYYQVKMKYVQIN